MPGGGLHDTADERGSSCLRDYTDNARVGAERVFLPFWVVWWWRVGGCTNHCNKSFHTSGPRVEEDAPPLLIDDEIRPCLFFCVCALDARPVGSVGVGRGVFSSVLCCV